MSQRLVMNYTHPWVSGSSPAPVSRDRELLVVWGWGNPRYDSQSQWRDPLSTAARHGRGNVAEGNGKTPNPLQLSDRDHLMIPTQVLLSLLCQ